MVMARLTLKSLLMPLEGKVQYLLVSLNRCLFFILKLLFILYLSNNVKHILTGNPSSGLVRSQRHRFIFVSRVALATKIQMQSTVVIDSSKNDIWRTSNVSKKYKIEVFIVNMQNGSLILAFKNFIFSFIYFWIIKMYK